jgi:predicted ester cyclase
MAAEGNTAIALRYWEAWETGNLAIIDEVFVIDHVFHTASGGMVRGRDRPKRVIMSSRSVFPDPHLGLEPVLAGEDKVLVCWSAHGTHRGDIAMGRNIPPTGKQVTWCGIDIYHIMGGKIVESWRSSDRLGFLQQLGGVST